MTILLGRSFRGSKTLSANGSDYDSRFANVVQTAKWCWFTTVYESRRNPIFISLLASRHSPGLGQPIRTMENSSALWIVCLCICVPFCKCECSWPEPRLIIISHLPGSFPSGRDPIAVTHSFLKTQLYVPMCLDSVMKFSRSIVAREEEKTFRFLFGGCCWCAICSLFAGIAGPGANLTGFMFSLQIVKKCIRFWLFQRTNISCVFIFLQRLFNACPTNQFSISFEIRSCTFTAH